jgi:DNA-binding MarR family transcriptional regulator
MGSSVSVSPEPRDGDLPKSSTSDRETAHYMLRLRKAANSCFGPSAPTEATWSVLLVLFSSDLARKGLQIASISRRADVPRTTVLRSLLKLQEGGFVKLAPDPNDKRAVRVTMTAEGVDAMHRCFTAARFIR